MVSMDWIGPKNAAWARFLKTCLKWPTPATTGLPMTVWVSPRGNASHDVRVKVNMTHGNQMNVANTAVVAVRPQPRVVTGRLLSTDEQAVFAWVTLNEAALVDYGDGRVDTAGLVGRLRRIRQPACW
jgi:hypothetical protein